MKQEGQRLDSSCIQSRENQKWKVFNLLLNKVSRRRTTAGYPIPLCHSHSWMEWWHWQHGIFEQRKEQIQYRPNLSLITGISESNLQTGDRRAITKSEVTFVIEAADGGRARRKIGEGQPDWKSEALQCQWEWKQGMPAREGHWILTVLSERLWVSALQFQEQMLT